MTLADFVPMTNYDPITITVLGSGTSVGVPVIGCDCAVCRSDNPRDKRQRPSVLVSYGDGAQRRNVLIDTTPDFRQQALQAGFRTLDAIFYTHAHADHIMGLDDVRPFNYGRQQPIPVYAAADTLERILHVFPYAFSNHVPHPGGSPRLTGHVLNGDPVDLFGLSFRPVPIKHGPLDILGYRFGQAAYLTDDTEVPPQSRELLSDLDVLFLDALRHEPHPMHKTVEQALAVVEQLQPRRAFFTHISCRLPHDETNAGLPAHVRLAYDGMRVEVDRGSR
jgi:phosphoribosyl 1,2-cyclic phosphate phosphodiesterase